MAPRRTFIRGADLEPALQALRVEFEVPAGFAAAALAEAARASWSRADRTDATDVPLVTLDPLGSRDLDQAFALTRRGDGFRFHYAIADVAAFVEPESALAAEAQQRAETLYLPDGRSPLYPPELSEGRASLLPDGERPAVLWRMDLDGGGEPVTVDVRRAVVRSRAQLDYGSFATSGHELVELLERVGKLRQRRERQRGGVSLDVPEQDVSMTGGHWTLDYRTPAAVEGWNAQLSLLTGMAAASLMIDAKVGLLRTMPRAPRRTIASLRRSADALGIAWPPGVPYAQVIRGLDASKPAHAALLRLASTLFRGAGYVAFDGTLPVETSHAAVAAPYAHATAPLRRLADRFVSEVCLAVSAGAEVPQWARAGLPGLPHVMAAADQRAHQIDHAVVNLAETLLLAGRVGEVFTGVIVEAEPGHGEIQLRDPAVKARIDGTGLPLGQTVSARLTAADVATRQLRFALA